RELPNGANLHLAASRDGRFIYLACNEPRWGNHQVGGRLPPWAEDPLLDPRGVIESERGPAEPAPTPAPSAWNGLRPTVTWVSAPPVESEDSDRYIPPPTQI